MHSSDSRALKCWLLDPSAFPRLATAEVRLVSLRPTLRLLGAQAGLLTCYVSAVYH